MQPCTVCRGDRRESEPQRRSHRCHWGYRELPPPTWEGALCTGSLSSASGTFCVSCHQEGQHYHQQGSLTNRRGDWNETGVKRHWELPARGRVMLWAASDARSLHRPHLGPWPNSSTVCPAPTLTSRHHQADVLHREYRQLFFRVHPDDPIGQPVHGEDAPAWGLVAVIRGPVRAVLSEYEEAESSSQVDEHLRTCTPEAAARAPQGSWRWTRLPHPRCFARRRPCLIC